MFEGKMINCVDRSAIIGAKLGAATSVAPLQTAGVDMVTANKFQKFMATFLLLDMAAETINCQICLASDAAATGLKAISSVTLAASASANDNKQVRIEIDAALLKDETTLCFLSARVITGSTVGGTVAIILEGFDERNGPIKTANALIPAEMDRGDDVASVILLKRIQSNVILT